MTVFSSLRALRVATGSWDVLGAQARVVRQAVFVVEQSIADEDEWDQWDALSLHAIALDGDGKAVGTGRLLPVAFDPAAPRVGHIGRLAVQANARRAGVGSLILAGLMRSARECGMTAIELNAQTGVTAFYARHGFAAFGAGFVEVGIAHVKMRAALRAA